MVLLNTVYCKVNKLIIGEIPQGCAYNFANIKEGELWMVVENGDHIAHNVGHKHWVRI
jgi:hypothetical protein